jgi:hypothetical protein
LLEYFSTKSSSLNTLKDILKNPQVLDLPTGLNQFENATVAVQTDLTSANWNLNFPYLDAQSKDVLLNHLNQIIELLEEIKKNTEKSPSSQEISKTAIIETVKLLFSLICDILRKK